MSIEEYEFLDEYRNSGTGISDLDFRAARYMLRPFALHGREFHRYWDDTKEMLKKLFQTDNDLVGMTGSIRLGFDAIISNIVEPGDRVLILSNGYWGNYVVRVVESYGGVPLLHEESPTRALDPKKVEEEIRKEGDVKAVTVMHVETDTGIAHPVAEIGRVVKENSDALYVVDCATSFGGMEVNVDDWEADFCFTGSHKCLSSPVGLVFITVSNEAWDVIRKRKTPILGTYNNLLPWREPISGECEPPLPAAIIHAVRAKLEYIFRHGPEKIYKKHEIAAKALRLGVIEMGLELLSESAEAPPCSNVVTTVKYPEGVSIENVTKIMGERYGIGFLPSPYRPGCFQLGTINESQLTPRHILYLLTCIGLTFSELGVKVRLEDAIRTANSILINLEELR
ncbi:MAG: aminotransferase class V-fold PLP-dependent enzyme [Candidatus Bathyarchaeia archaeon]